MHDIHHAQFPADLEAVVGIFREYVTSPTVDLGFQDYEQEFRHAAGRLCSTGWLSAAR